MTAYAKAGYYLDVTTDVKFPHSKKLREHVRRFSGVAMARKDARILAEQISRMRGCMRVTMARVEYHHEGVWRNGKQA